MTPTALPVPQHNSAAATAQGKPALSLQCSAAAEANADATHSRSVSPIAGMARCCCDCAQRPGEKIRTGNEPNRFCSHRLLSGLPTGSWRKCRPAAQAQETQPGSKGKGVAERRDAGGGQGFVSSLEQVKALLKTSTSHTGTRPSCFLPVNIMGASLPLLNEHQKSHYGTGGLLLSQGFPNPQQPQAEGMHPAQAPLTQMGGQSVAQGDPTQ